MCVHPALVTGFAPYAGRGRNPAADIANALDGRSIAEVPIVGRLLPVALDEIADKAESLLSELKPRVVISIGLWPGETMVRIERVGLNLADFEIPDNHGRLAHDKSLSGNGPAAKFTTLPVRKIEAALLAAGIPSRISNSAGSFLCNACLYSFLSAPKKRPAHAAVSFMCRTCRSRWPACSEQLKEEANLKRISVPTSPRWIWRPAPERLPLRSRPLYVRRPEPPRIRISHVRKHSGT